MNRDELRQILADEGFRSDVYSLDGGLSNDTHCLEDRRYLWAVYYSERGRRKAEQVFHTEAEACEFLLDRLRQDPTAKVRPD